MVAKTVQLVIRVEPGVVERADEIVAHLVTSGLGVEPSRTAVLRTALMRGLAAMEAEQKKPSRKR